MESRTVHRSAECAEPNLEAAYRRALYAQSSAAAAERLLHDHAISHEEYLRRVASQQVAQRCLEQWRQAHRTDHRSLMDGEQDGVD